MKVTKFGDVVHEVKINVDRDNNPYEFYIAGDHMDSEDLTIHRKGHFATDDVGPAFTRIFKPGQILYGSRRTYLKKIAVADFEGICANTTFVLETKDNCVFLQSLLPFIMLSDKFTEWSVSHSKGSTNPYVLFSDLASYEFELPSLEEQSILSKKLWAAYRLKESYKRLLTATDEMVKSALISAFLSSKSVEGCSEKTIAYYRSTLNNALLKVGKKISHVTTNDLRTYLNNYQKESGASKVTVDNIRRILSSFFAWLEDENYIVKSPVRRIHKVKVGKTVKEIYSDEALEIMRDHAGSSRDLAMIDLLASTGMRVGELVKLNKSDIDFQNRECIVTGKGDKQRKVYFDARTKIHLQNYLSERTDNNEALFVSLLAPFERLLISGVEIRLRKLGRTLNISKVHPHKFRRTLATMAIDKGMPIEQVQHLLGHQSLDTTLQYAMVNQNNVKLSHRKYLG